jgi:hypothetical protein
MVETISALSDLSSKLNQKSNNLNKLFASVNDRLSEMNFGTEVWLLDDPIEATDPNDWDDDAGMRTEPWRDATLLGYCEIEDEWQLAVKDTVLVDKISRQGHSYQEVRNSRQPIPLLKSSRIIRMKAASLIPSLLDEIKSETQRLLKSLDEAEAAAKKL